MKKNKAQQKKYGIFFSLVCMIIAGLLVQCGGKTRQANRGGQPNILLITIDTLRPDRLSAYGYKGHETRNIDRLAKEGAAFDNAYCDVNWTTPSMASTLTGTYAYKHGVRSMYTRLPDPAVTIAETLKNAGYSTAAVIGAFPLDSIYGLDQGFDVYNDTFSEPIYTGARTPPQDIPSTWGESINERKKLFFKKIVNKSRRSDQEVTETAVNLLKELSKNQKPFFLWVHYFGPHDVPDLRLSRLDNWKIHAAGYAGKVLNTDKAVGDLLSALDSYGLSRETLVIFHADHGESLGEHRFVGHGVYLYEDNLRIPLLMRWPGKIPGGRRYPQLVGNVDLSPTLLEAAGIKEKKPGYMDGKSLLPVIRSGISLHPSLYFETYLCAHDIHAEVVDTGKGQKIKVGIRSYGILEKPWKYIVTDFFPLFDAVETTMGKDIQERVQRFELFDLDNDPGELRSMVGTGAGASKVRELGRLLSRHTELDQTGIKNRMKLTRDQLDKLKSLGYVK